MCIRKAQAFTHCVFPFTGSICKSKRSSVSVIYLPGPNGVFLLCNPRVIRACKPVWPIRAYDINQIYRKERKQRNEDNKHCFDVSTGVHWSSPVSSSKVSYWSMPAASSAARISASSIAAPLRDAIPSRTPISSRHAIMELPP